MTRTNVITLRCRGSELAKTLELSLYLRRKEQLPTDQQLAAVHALLDHITGRGCGYVDTEKYLHETSKETIT
jgi:hypothetical protein